MSQYPADPPAMPGDAGKSSSHRLGLPRYKLVLLWNPANDLMAVVRTVMELTRYCRAEATYKMWQAHHHGRSVILVTYLERAELYVEQFASKGLQVAIEAA
jgi:ATP-dependent Clp protease adaptor protein ClpS